MTLCMEVPVTVVAVMRLISLIVDLYRQGGVDGLARSKWTTYHGGQSRKKFLGVWRADGKRDLPKREFAIFMRPQEIVSQLAQFAPICFH